MIASFLRQPFGLATLFFALGIAFIALILVVSGPILITLAISLMIYAAMKPSVDAMVRNGLKETMAVALTMGLIIIIVLLVILTLFPLVMQQVADFSSRLTRLETQLLYMLNQIDSWVRQHTGYAFDPSDATHQVINHLSERASILLATISNWFDKTSFTLMLIPLIVFFLLRDFRQLRNETMRLLPNRYFELGWLVYNGAAAQLQQYIRGLSIQAFVITGICSAGFYLVGLEFAPLLGITVALLNIIPFFGMSLAKIPPLLVVVLSEQADFTTAALTLAVVFVAQAVNNAWLLPNIVARSANMHPLTVIIGVALAGYYYGFFGLILIVPILFSMKVVFQELLKGLRSIHGND